MKQRPIGPETLDLEISVRNRYRDSTATREKVFIIAIEVVTSVQRRRRWSAVEKKPMVGRRSAGDDHLCCGPEVWNLSEPGIPLAHACNEGALSAVAANEGVVPASEVKELKKQIRELQLFLGRKMMEAEILKEAVRLVGKKKLIWHMPLLAGDDSR